MKNFLLTLLAITFIFTVSSCGGGGGGGSSATPVGSGADNPIPTVSNQDFEDITEEQRTEALTAEQSFGSVTQGTMGNSVGITGNSIGIAKNADDSPILNNALTVFAETLPVREFTAYDSVNEQYYDVRLTNAIIGGFAVIFDEGTFSNKTDYETGDFYMASGFWHQSNDNFGTFADGTPRTVDLPTSGSATYEGFASAVYWSSERLDRFENAAFGNMFGRSDLTVSFADSEMQLAGGISMREYRYLPGEGDRNMNEGDSIDDSISEFLDNPINFRLMPMTADSDGNFGNGNVICFGECDEENAGGSTWGAQFVGNPITTDGGDDSGATTGGWPAGLVGTFGADNFQIDGADFDILGNFVSIHSGLCVANGSTALDDSDSDSGSNGFVQYGGCN